MKKRKIIKAVIILAIVLSLASAIVITAGVGSLFIFDPFGIASALNLSTYRVSNQESFVPYAGAADIYNASRDELIELNMCDYPHTFGEVKNEKEAAKIAAKVIEEVYQKSEAPYVVKFNENANAWIVNGSMPFPISAGGVASMAIDKDTGEILMLIHTK